MEKKVGKEQREVCYIIQKKGSYCIKKKYVLLIFYLLRVRRHYINNKKYKLKQANFESASQSNDTFLCSYK